MKREDVWDLCNAVMTCVENDHVWNHLCDVGMP